MCATPQGPVMREMLMQAGVIGFVLLTSSILAQAAGNDRSDDKGKQITVGGTQTSGIEGQVSIGPVRPIERKGVANQRPYEARITVLNATGREIASVNSNPEGKFRIALPPGTYVLRPEQPGLYPRASAQQVKVSRDRITQVDITYDSGIR